jgi:pyruvate ferredoxin oxidoreductase beta subunit
MSRLATETCFWPLFEVENGEFKVNYRPREKKQLMDWLKPQRRFQHLMTDSNTHIVEDLQADVDRKWEALLARAGITTD